MTALGLWAPSFHGSFPSRPVRPAKALASEFARFKARLRPSSDEAKFEVARAPARRPTTVVEEMVGRLQSLARYGEGWDGRHGAAADRVSFENARAFAYMLGTTDPVPAEALHANGNAVLAFETVDGRASLQFYPDGVIAAYVERAGVEWDDDVHFDGRRIPDALRERIGLKGDE